MQPRGARSGIAASIASTITSAETCRCRCIPTRGATAGAEPSAVRAIGTGAAHAPEVAVAAVGIGRAERDALVLRVEGRTILLLRRPPLDAGSHGQRAHRQRACDRRCCEDFAHAVSFAALLPRATGCQSIPR